MLRFLLFFCQDRWMMLSDSLMFSVTLQVLRWWHSHKSVQKQQRLGSQVPVQSTHETILKLVERRWLGNKGRSGEDRLVQGALRRLLQGLSHRRMRVVGECQILCYSGKALVGSEGISRPRCLSVSSPQMGSEEIHNLQLLYWSSEVP